MAVMNDPGAVPTNPRPDGRTAPAAPPFISVQDCWTAVVARDADADGVFFYSVRTTGVYCRPSCAARLPRRENVAFHDTIAGAEAAGFRPCKRCCPRGPTAAQRGPKSAPNPIRFAVSECSLGAILVAVSDRGVCAILLGDDPEPLLQDIDVRFPGAELAGPSDGLAHPTAKVVKLVDDPATDLDVPLDIRGTAFQKRVWQVLRGIPAGETASYAEIAERIGKPAAARAVARACAANPIAVAVPCHRVVRSDGGLSGYRWGVARKRLLLEREAAA